MLTLTEPAADHLLQRLKRAKAPRERAVRFLPGDRSVSTKIDRPGPGDTAIRHGDRTVALLDREAARRLAGMTLDVEETEEGTELILLPSPVTA